MKKISTIFVFLAGAAFIISGCATKDGSWTSPAKRNVTSSLDSFEYTAQYVPTVLALSNNVFYAVHSDADGTIYLTFKNESSSQKTLTKFSILTQENLCTLKLSEPVVLVPNSTTMLRMFSRSELTTCAPKIAGYSEINTLTDRPADASKWLSVSVALDMAWTEELTEHTLIKAIQFYFIEG